jgi:hypothetical protein
MLLYQTIWFMWNLVVGAHPSSGDVLFMAMFCACLLFPWLVVSFLSMDSEAYHYRIFS